MRMKTLAENIYERGDRNEQHSIHSQMIDARLDSS